MISNGYMALVNAGQEMIQAGDDASDAKWFDVSFQEEDGVWSLCLTHGDEKLDVYKRQWQYAIQP